ncbi:MAG: hypothetical protein RL235_1075 [Chlamydiota bacterium]|jgi:large subunit ribosomal protein L9
MKRTLLLLEDVDALGKKGEVVTAKAGYVRNFLMPRGFAMPASPNVLRKQEKLRAERAKQAVIDKRESEELSAKIETLTLETRVKVDPEGHMYGSVSAGDIALLFQEQGYSLEKRSIQLPRPIKETGVHKLTVRLKEGVTAVCSLHIIPEGVVMTGAESVTAPLPGAEVVADSERTPE